MATATAALPHLFAFPPAWNLPTHDADCLTVQALMKFSKYTFVAKDCTTPEMSPSEDLPFLRLPDDTLLAGDEVFAEVRKTSDLNKALTQVQLADHEAYLALVLHKIRPAVLYSLWCESENYEKVTRAIYNPKLPFPLSYVVPLQKRWRVSEQLSSLRTLLDHEELFDEAAQALASLSEKLADKLFFFGEEPTELDAHVFAHLFVILRAPLPVNELCICLKSYDNLVKYTERVGREYFKL